MKLATLCYIRRGGKTLMLHRDKDPSDFQYGKYNGLGGKFEEGESPEQCITREINEEAQILIQNPKLRGIVTFDNKGRTFNEEKPQPTWYVFIYTASEFEGEPKETKAGTLEWIADSDLLNLEMYEGDKLLLKWLEQPRLFSARLIYEGDALVRHEVNFY
jgi:8-oxo-dGTP diphosphatase